MTPAIDVMITAQTRIRMKLRWMPMLPAGAEDSTDAWALKKKLEPNHPTAYAPNA